MLFKDILIFLELDYRDASLMILYLVVIEIQIWDQWDYFITLRFVVKKGKKSARLKWTYGTSGSDYRVAIRNGRTDGPILIIETLRLLYMCFGMTNM